MPDEPATSDQPGTPDQPEPAEPAGFTQESSGYGYVPQNTPPAQPPPGYDGYQQNWPQEPATGWNPEAPGYPGYQGYPQPGPGYPQPDQGYPQPDQGYGQQWGQPQPWDQQQPPGYGYPVPGQPPPGQPRPGSPRTAWIVAGVVLAVLVLGGGVAYVLNHRSSPPCSTASGTSAAGCLPPTATPDPTTPGTTDPETTEPDPVQSTDPADPADATITTPDAAMAASEIAAEDALQTESDENDAVASNLQGKWVPQVSSKCVGVSADVGPNWIPDGTAETSSISINQILAFNLSLKERFGAITVRQTQVGINRDTGKSGVCKGEILWMSIVPQGFSSANAANEWCDANVPDLVDECLARYDARPGETSTPKSRKK